MNINLTDAELHCNGIIYPAFSFIIITIRSPTAHVHDAHVSVFITFKSQYTRL